MEKPTEFKIYNINTKRITTNKEGIVLANMFLMCGVFAGQLASTKGTVTEEMMKEIVAPMIFIEWTGKLDKDGVRIFDRDFLEVKMQNEFGSFQTVKGLVMWCEHQLAWAFYPDPYTEGSEHAILGMIPSSEVKVIGNNRDNPELLTGETNAK